MKINNKQHITKTGVIKKNPKKILKYINTPFGKFILGEKVYYDVFPDGENFLGVITEEGIRAIGKSRTKFEREGIDINVSFEDGITNVRKRGQ